MSTYLAPQRIKTALTGAPRAAILRATKNGRAHHDIFQELAMNPENRTDQPATPDTAPETAPEIEAGDGGFLLRMTPDHPPVQLTPFKTLRLIETLRARYLEWQESAQTLLPHPCHACRCTSCGASVARDGEGRGDR